MRQHGIDAHTSVCLGPSNRFEDEWWPPQRKYELRLLERDGRTIGVYAFNCSSDEKAKARIFTITDQLYDRFEIWKGMERIAEGGRFICVPVTGMGPGADRALYA